jgi:hypothetical protein
MHDLGLYLGAVLVHQLHQGAVRINDFVGGQMQTAGKLGVKMVDSGGA